MGALIWSKPVANLTVQFSVTFSLISWATWVLLHPQDEPNYHPKAAFQAVLTSSNTNWAPSRHLASKKQCTTRAKPASAVWIRCAYEIKIAPGPAARWIVALTSALSVCFFKSTHYQHTVPTHCLSYQESSESWKFLKILLSLCRCWMHKMWPLKLRVNWIGAWICATATEMVAWASVSFTA